MIIVQMDSIPAYKIAKEQQCLVGTLKALRSVCLANKDGSKKFGPIERLIQLKRCLTEYQKNMNNAKYREQVLATYEGLQGHIHKIPFGLGALYKVMSKKAALNRVSWDGVDMWEHYISLSKAARKELENKADDLTQACICTLV